MARAGVRLFLVGDVMLARGIDMIQRHSCDPVLYESNGLNAYDYVSLAVSRNGAIPSKDKRQVDYSWGDAVSILHHHNPDVRIINLETSITTNDTPWPAKGIHYRMHPGNVDVIKSAQIDCCVLSNNHTADWGFPGLRETLKTLTDAKIPYVGAGYNSLEASSPAVFQLPGKGRVLVFAGGHNSSGIPESWRASDIKEGVNIIDIHNTNRAVAALKSSIKQHKRDLDIVVLSVHWGGNWGFELEPFQEKFAHTVIKEAGVDVVHGHSSHHVKGIEVYKGKLIIYGCGDFLTDYEGITGHEKYRGDLALMYFPDIDPSTGSLLALTMLPTQTKHLRVNHAADKDIQWLQDTMSRECRKFNCDTKRVGNEIHLVFDK